MAELLLPPRFATQMSCREMPSTARQPTYLSDLPTVRVPYPSEPVESTENEVIIPEPGGPGCNSECAETWIASLVRVRFDTFPEVSLSPGRPGANAQSSVVNFERDGVSGHPSVVLPGCRLQKMMEPLKRARP